MMYPNLTNTKGVHKTPTSMLKTAVLNVLKRQRNKVLTCETCGYLYTETNRKEDCPQCGEVLK
jgi:rubrerythrin